MISTDGRISSPLSRLLLILAEGEKLASQCAARQSAGAVESRPRRFFRAQARHEQFHALLFQNISRWLTSHKRVVPEKSPGLTSYRRLLESAIESESWTEVLVGQQIVLENLGELVLSKLDREIERLGLGFSRTRSLVLRQERAHHNFGIHLLERELQADRVDRSAILAMSENYLELADRILADVSGLLEGIEADANAYRRELHGRLPAWESESS